MRLTSSAFEHNGAIPSKYTCDGENMSPPLRIEDVPEQTKSITLIMDDPDVPEHIRSDRMWDHWIVFNIPPDIKEIPEGTEPPGIFGKGTGGNLGYSGPCPPDRQHRYVFRAYAIDTMPDLSEGVSKQDVKRAMEGRVLGQAELIGLYERKG